MSAKTTIEIFAPAKAQAAYLESVLKLGGYETEKGAPVVVAAAEGFTAAEDQKILPVSTPVRAADLLESLRAVIISVGTSPAQIPIADGILDSHENLWLREGAEAVRLTEKETSILLCLHAGKGAVISRENLLHKVWAYAPEAETHTLETHIYRLRQKIEVDPSRPSVLLTEGDGYRIAG